MDLSGRDWLNVMSGKRDISEESDGNAGMDVRMGLMSCHSVDGDNTGHQ